MFVTVLMDSLGDLRSTPILVDANVYIVSYGAFLYVLMRSLLPIHTIILIVNFFLRLIEFFDDIIVIPMLECRASGSQNIWVSSVKVIVFAMPSPKFIRIAQYLITFVSNLS